MKLCVQMQNTQSFIHADHVTAQLTR